MGSKFFSNRHDNKTSKGKRKIKGSKKNTNSKIQSKGVGSLICQVLEKWVEASN